MKPSRLTLPSVLLALLAGCAAPSEPPASAKVAPMAAPVPTAPTPATAAPSPAEASSYQPLFQVSGRLRGVGSETLSDTMKTLMSGFSHHHPGVECFEEGLGSSTAISALMENRAELGPMSRYVRKAEETRFKSRFGYGPLQVRVAVDALAVFVHPDNPVAKRGLTLAELDAIYSSTRTRGAAQPIRTWGELGLTGEWASAPIRLFSRNTASGTYGFFRDNALLGGQFRVGVQELVGSHEVAEAVAADRFAIGYSGIAFKSARIAAVPLADETGGRFIPPSRETALNYTYPLTRFLFIAVNKEPGKPASEMVREWFRYVFSPEGGRAVEQGGFFVLPAATRSAEEGLLR